jgi:hypothetical protein
LGIALLVALVTAACVASPASRVLPSLAQDQHRAVPVVVIALDELPTASLMNLRGNVDRRAYPNLRRLADDSTWFRNTTTVATFTKEALPALLTGAYPPRSPDETHFFPYNLFTMLSDAYGVRAVGNMPRLCPALCIAGHNPSDVLSPRLEVFEAGDRGRTFTSFLQMIQATGRPALHFIHLLLPHKPWRFLPSGQRYDERDPMPGEIDPPGRGHGWAEERWPTSQAWQRHLLQVGLVDRLIGIAVRHMKDSGIYDESLLVVTADHGVAFEPGLPTRLLRRRTVGQLAYVPLFVKEPYQRNGVVSDTPVEIVDLVPTVADALDLSDTWPNVQGTSAFDLDGTPRSRGFDGLSFYGTGAELWAAVRAKYSRWDQSAGTIHPFRLAPCGLEELIGQDVGAISAPDGAATAHLAKADALEEAGPRDQVFPALVEGEVVEEAGAGALVAIAVNGRIAAVTKTYRFDGARTFSAMIPPKAFGAPPNDVTAHVVGTCSN